MRLMTPDSVNPYEPPAEMTGSSGHTEPKVGVSPLGTAGKLGLALAFALPIVIATFAMMILLLDMPEDKLQPWLSIFWICAGAEPLALALCIYEKSRSRARVVNFAIALSSIGSIYFALALLTSQ
jgi:hypothetical protein